MEAILEEQRTPSSMKVQSWGWKLIRFPNQLQISASTGRMTTSQHQKQLTPRAVLLAARGTGLPGWDILDETMITPWKNSVWSRFSKSSVQFTVRVPPHPRYLAAIADIARTSNQLQTKLGWTAEVPRGANGLQQDVPALPVKAAASPATSSTPNDPTQSSEATSSAPAFSSTSATSTTAPVDASDANQSSSAVTGAVPSHPSPLTNNIPAPSSSSRSSVSTRAPSQPPSRFYFYLIDENGRLLIEDETSATSKHGLGLRDRRTLNVLYSQMRVANEAMQQAPLGEHLTAPVVVPPGAQVAGLAPNSSDRTLPLSQLASSYPFLSLCAGEVNFFRCDIVPIVFRALVAERARRNDAPSSSSPTSMLRYAGDLLFPFDPRRLAVDSSGRLFHPAPQIGTSTSSALGLISSHLAQELVLHETPFTTEEMAYTNQQQEETRRLTVEVHEDFQRRLQSSPSQFAGTTPNQWIHARVQEQLTQLGLGLQYSNYVIEWQGQVYRIRNLAVGELNSK